VIEMIRQDNGIQVSAIEWLEALTGLPSRYDLLLVVIPAAFVLSLLVGHLFSVTPRLSMAAAAVVGAAALVDGLFVNPPQAGSGPE
jgi:hypothetical protein